MQHLEEEGGRKGSRTVRQHPQKHHRIKVKIYKKNFRNFSTNLTSDDKQVDFHNCK